MLQIATISWRSSFRMLISISSTMRSPYSRLPFIRKLKRLCSRLRTLNMQTEFSNSRLQFNMNLRRSNTPSLLLLKCHQMRLRLLLPKVVCSIRKRSTRRPKTSSRKLSTFLDTNAILLITFLYVFTNKCSSRQVWNILLILLRKELGNTQNWVSVPTLMAWTWRL